MIIWFILFFIVVLVSLVLAYKSMEDYRETTAGLNINYSLFLVRQPEALTKEVINSLHQSILKEGLILSFERLFKGAKSALVIFGPFHILQPFSSNLGLLELEDYTHKIDPSKLEKGSSPGVAAWEVGTKNPPADPLFMSNLFQTLPPLESEEEWWWQVAVQPRGKADSGKLQQPFFQSVLRSVIISSIPKRAQSLQESLSHFGSEAGLAFLPQPYTISQLVKFYQERSLPHSLGAVVGKASFPFLTAGEILQLIEVK